MKRKTISNLGFWSISKWERLLAFWTVLQNLHVQESSRNSQHFFLQCAFNVRCVGEKMRYWDTRNGVENFRICSFAQGGRILTNSR